MSSILELFQLAESDLRMLQILVLPAKQFSDYIYSILYWSNPEHAIGLGRFLLKLKVSDEFFACCICGPLFGSRLHPNEVDILGKIGLPPIKK